MDSPYQRNSPMSETNLRGLRLYSIFFSTKTSLDIIVFYFLCMNRNYAALSPAAIDETAGPAIPGYAFRNHHVRMQSGTRSWENRRR